MGGSVYVLGAGFSAGLGFPVTTDLLPLALARLSEEERKLTERVLEFHFPDFNASDVKTYPNIEDVLTRIRINLDLFYATRAREGQLRHSDLALVEGNLLHALVQLFHEIRTEIAIPGPAWLRVFVEQVKREKATIISFNWDLVLDVLLGDDKPKQSLYAAGLRFKNRTCLLKPHGSLNWYSDEFAQHFKEGRAIPLWKPARGKERRFDSVWLFSYPRHPITSVGRRYVPWIVPPTFIKSFEHPFFQHIFRVAVERLGSAKEVFFLGYSMPQYDYHAEFMLRCGFHVQREGAISTRSKRSRVSGRSKVTVVNPDAAAADRIKRVLGVECRYEKMSVATWIRAGNLSTNT